MRSRALPLIVAVVVAASFSLASADGGHHAQPGQGAGFGSPLPHPAMHDMMMAHGFGHEPGHAGMGPGMHGVMGPGMHGAMGPGMHGAMTPGMSFGMDGAMAGLVSLSGEAFDARFLSAMIAHHEGAIAAADAILVTTEDPFVREAAESILATQQAEIDQMNAWSQAWFGGASGGAAPATMGSGPMDMGVPSAAQSPTTPDAAFLADMIRHHQQAIDMAQLALERSGRSEILDLARDIIAAQSAEVRAFASALRDEGAPR
ncbi:MAG: DUF305 domain-containing protein [Trueperaceae bacterium]